MQGPLRPYIFIYALLIATFAGCNKPMNAQENNKIIKEGIIGQLIWIEGNQMPSVGFEGQEIPAGQPVQREVHIYELTKTSQVEQKDNFYTNIQTELVKTVMSDKNGVFKVSLPPGKYSLFVKEPKGLFANLFDGYGQIMPVEVYKDEVNQIAIQINYMASF